ncbi:TolC family protein [Vibrio ponticus]|uniref:TolC family protein n=1 Tax=Vibrio ponticus TaxID=265668 RepID=A0A3N3DZ31_9VIBR|nr:TolC family protein [Vibrio ponticus]
MDCNVKAKYNFLALSLCLAIGAPALAHTKLESQVIQTASNSSLLESTLTLEQIIAIALQQDASREQLFAQSQATLSGGKAKATLMDPTVKFGFGGVPVDSFRLDQDPMSNISLGVMQKFDRGDTIELQTSQAEQQSQAVLQQAKAREHDVITTVTAVWLELGYNQKAKSLLLQQEKWLKQLINNQDSNYALGIGESQDVIAAQLKLSQLQQKLVSNAQVQQKLTAQLSEWLGREWQAKNSGLQASNQLDWHDLQQTLAAHSTAQTRYQLLMRHPVIQSLDSSLASAQTQVSIAEEAYAPQFGVEVMYAHRQANNMRGEPAPDMVSAYITLDIPLYTGSKQDKSLEAAQYQVGAAKSQRDAWLARMGAQLTGLISDRDHLQHRISHYQSHLLKQATAQLAAVERGYQNNSASFGDIVTSSLTQITIELELERLITDFNLTNNQIANLIGDYSSTSITKAERQEK